MTDTATFSLRTDDGAVFGPTTLDVIGAWASEGRVPRDGVLVAEADGAERPVLDEPSLARILQAPPTARPASVRRDEKPADGDAVSLVIPYRNPQALASYYLGLFSLFPFLGLFLAVPALILGIVGLRRRAADPRRRGAVHAWIGIIMGGLLTLVWGGLGIVLLLSV